MANVILHLSDWNHQDKYYEAPYDLLTEFVKRLKSDGWDSAWEWWVDQVDYSHDRSGPEPIKFGTVDMTLDTYFLDYEAISECLAEWEEDLEV